MVTVIYSEEFLQHLTGRLHPESPNRLKAVVEALKNVVWGDEIDWRTPTPIQERDILPLLSQIHDRAYIEKVQEIAATGGGMLDPDTVISPKSYEVALLAVSGWLDGVEEVIKTGKQAFVLARPPGHHAERETGMGFCLFSNSAIASYYAIQQPSINRVAILDWDVHHGNGTQSIVEANPQIAYCSLHQSPCYPGTGSGKEKGKYNNVLNIPMSRGSTLAAYETAFTQKVMPFLTNFQPDLLIVSAGYDANQADPLAGISLQPQDYGVLTDYCLEVTTSILFGLEGGYDLPTLSASVLATLEACLEQNR